MWAVNQIIFHKESGRPVIYLGIFEDKEKNMCSLDGGGRSKRTGRYTSRRIWPPNYTHIKPKLTEEQKKELAELEKKGGIVYEPRR